MKRIRFNYHLYLVIFVGLLIALFITRFLLKEYWVILFCFFIFAAPILAFLYARRLGIEADMREWRKEAATIDPAQINRDTNEGQRQWLVILYARRDYQEAAEYAVTLTDEVLRFAPCERLADFMRWRNPEVARRLYQATIERYSWDGNNATGSGEGLMAMDNIKRVESKLKKVKRQH